MTGARYNKGKPRHSLRSPWADEGLAKVFTAGAEKYTVWGECNCSCKVDPEVPGWTQAHTAECASRTIISKGEWNWAKGLSWLETVDSLQRHLTAFLKGEELDNGPGGTGLPHIDHVAWNAHALSHFQKTQTGTDDRWKRIVPEDKP